MPVQRRVNDEGAVRASHRRPAMKVCAHYYIFASLSLLDLRDRPNHERLERRTLSLNQEDLSGRRDSHRLVFLDETGTTTKMASLRGRSLRGQRLLSKVPFGHCKTHRQRNE